MDDVFMNERDGAIAKNIFQSISVTPYLPTMIPTMITFIEMHLLMDMKLS